MTLTASGHRVTSSAAWGAVGVLWLAALLFTGSTASTVAQWIAGFGLGVVLPGVAVVRVCRRQAAALIEDIGWGVPAGCLVAFAGWGVGVLSPWGMPAWLFGPLVVAALMMVPRLRDRVLARPAPGWGRGPTLVLAFALIVMVGWMLADFLLRYPASPAGHAYYPDSVFQLAVVGALRHSLELTYPLVAGEPFSYQWFAHAVLAHLVDGGPDAFDTVIRLAPATFLPAVVVTAAVVARDVANKIIAGPLAAILIAVVGTTVATWTTEGQSQAVFQTYWWASLTTNFGWLATLPVAGCVVAMLRGHTPSAPVGLLVPFTVLALGAKPSNVAVLLGGAVLALLYLAVTRQPWRRAALSVTVLGAVLLLGRLTIYGSTYGLRLDVLGGFQQQAAHLFPGLTEPGNDRSALAAPEVATTALLATILLFTLPLLPRLAGLPVLLSRQRRDPATWFFLGTLAAGAGALAVFRHPAGSEAFFLLSAYPIAVVGSAWGLSLLLDQRSAQLRALTGAAIGMAAATGIALLVPADPLHHLTGDAGHPPTADETAAAMQVAHYLLPLGVLTVLVAAAVTVVAAWHRHRRRSSAAPFAAGMVLGTGLLSTGLYLTSAAPTLSADTLANGHNIVITADERAAAQWVAAHSEPNDVVAVNRVCLGSSHEPEHCVAKAFGFGALAQRPTYVGGWAYASRNHETAWESEHGWAAQPFWDPVRLQRNQDAFTHPTPAVLGALSDDNVRWLVADTRGWPADTTSLDQLAQRRLSTPTVTVWEIG